MIYEEKIHEKKALFKNNSNLCKDVWDSGNAGAVTVSESGRYIPTKSGEKYMHRRFNTYSDAFSIQILQRLFADLLRRQQIRADNI